MESAIDLNLYVALDALLGEGSVTGAAQRLHTSAPAMSRTLARLRRLLDDPILVRAGRTMVPTPRALDMQDRVRDFVDQGRRLLEPVERSDPAVLRRTFSVQLGDLLSSTIGSRLVTRVRGEAPGVTLRFVGDSHEDTEGLRDGTVDLEIGQMRRTLPETHIEALLSDRMVGVVRKGHRLARGRVTLRRFADAEHVVSSRRGRLTGPIDDLLAEHGLQRRVVVCTPSVASSLQLIQHSDLVGILPEVVGADAIADRGLHAFPIPLELPALELSMSWHPRYDADGAQRWLRQCVRDAFAAR
ncbi:LysR family transcriptional regulator [Mycolicibacterium madagascariense]|uniref:LysR family transcriptional regulator n=1 Tax=Mycolicibacterium madagascariense TaxID=212765 RepID=A0A7I7XA34_9MYCO|nr:LysR family transcriptional regulator [Mycolicibacterium madagascariense]MCV7012918.1 LysR family transcriptional regulator [Mycolicibacterium madagascariense]BBZ26165.1 LysR family transcriptional regulator [Mycolicibacterium madagascariense]